MDLPTIHPQENKQCHPKQNRPPIALLLLPRKTKISLPTRRRRMNPSLVLTHTTKAPRRMIFNRASQISALD
jgi:hypothetical protein